ncbi:MAG: argininosuccinate lyase [Gammaproteobacteria bacterium]|nr:argininosuccinate lyase [Gammaproteobacteria bacterium]
MTNTKLWGGRYSQVTDPAVEKFTASVQFDRELYPFDIAGSIVHAKMLCKVKILSADEADRIISGLQRIAEEIGSGVFPWSDELEDVHMNIEARLTEYIGEAGKKLHTARSRNDQVATDMRLYLRAAIDRILGQLIVLQRDLIELAEREADTIMPGFTHLQVAQPITFGHHIMAWFEMFDRDSQRLGECRARVNRSPLGAAALAGTSFDIDREFTAKELGCDGPMANSLDAVSDRDFLIEFAGHAALLMIHLSRMAEELVLWTSDRFRFVQLSDAFCTGSSIMPQKKNPDVAELIRGKVGRVTGNLNTLLMVMKAQPLAYNRDNQEDKEPMFDSVATIEACLGVFGAMIPHLSVNADAMRQAAASGYATATDLAEYLVRKGTPFRDAHEIVGKVVQHALQVGCDLSEISLAELQRFSGAIEKDVYQVLTLEGSVSSRDHFGGTAPDQVRQACVEARTRVAAAAKFLQRNK